MRQAAAKKASSTTEPMAYSYNRFSTPEQAQGFSEERQVENAKRYAAKLGLILDDSLKTDKGKSGYRGANRKTGALATFLDMIDKGKIARDSVLIVENMDRLSREPFTDAFETISRIIRAGVSIQTLSPEAHYDKKSLNGHAIYALVAQIQMAHAESEKKSERLKDARRREKDIAAKGGRHPNTKNIQNG